MQPAYLEEDYGLLTEGVISGAWPEDDKSLIAGVVVVFANGLVGYSPNFAPSLRGYSYNPAKNIDRCVSNMRESLRSYGFVCGRYDGLSGQDIAAAVIVTKSPYGNYAEYGIAAPDFEIDNSVLDMAAAVSIDDSALTPSLAESYAQLSVEAPSECYTDVVAKATEDALYRGRNIEAV